MECASNGTEKLRIGELANLSNVTKRTIDYYTSIGLLKAERSASNYRVYSIDAVDKLKMIEKCKADSMSLVEIRNLLSTDRVTNTDPNELINSMQTLEKEANKIVEYINENKLNKEDFLRKHLSSESMTLLKSLILLLV
ncbi:DNA-binding transcriptional MerR regulator [Bacillus pakistanensis]|uniref:DNA-binding transcriptional MerR regulator n=1 Tax=Rossellomorea pakistanensis TaxID=992288 RepID=A0ABS2NGQ0_9BACI|nr:MerR family transcriptional regulator [Bacillus pakistanensis]MBM7587040.1 DNA-binding transcriptional MerR regulator [Bacillus pakistanensis]